MPRVEIVGVNSDIHGKRSCCFRELTVGMSLEMPSAVMGTVPDAHGIVTQYYGLPFDRDFR